MNSANFAEEAADWFADYARDHFMVIYERSAKICESEIERMLLAAMIATMTDVDFSHLSFSVKPSDADLAGKFLEHFWAMPKFCGAIICPQVTIGSYRVDFLMKMGGDSGQSCGLVIECDGHDFHERTPKQAARDRKRDRDLQALGYRVMRFTGSEICRDAFACADEVRKVWIDFQMVEVRVFAPEYDKDAASAAGDGT